MRILSVLTLSTLLAACSTGDPEASAYRALQSGDYTAAVTSFDKAIAATDPSSPELLGLTVARCQALAHTDETEAKNALIALAGTPQSGVTAADYRLVAEEMVDAGEHVSAVELLNDGYRNRFEGDVKIRLMIDRINTEASKSDDTEVADALKGLGYVGDE